VTVTANSPVTATDTAIANADLKGTEAADSTPVNCQPLAAEAQANSQATPVVGQVLGISTTAPALVTPSTGAGGSGMLRSLLVGLFLMAAGITVLTGLRRNPHAAI
jgi:hypothetical protein